MPLYSPTGDLITAVEYTGLKLTPMVQEFRAEGKIAKHDNHSKPNMTREEARTLKELTMDMEVPMVVLIKQDYINNTQNLLVQRDTCRPFKADPNNKHKNKLINMLKTVKAKGGLGDTTFITLSNWCSHQNSMGYP